MKKKKYQELRILLCTLSTTVLVTGCTTRNSQYEESKQTITMETEAEINSAIEETIKMDVVVEETTVIQIEDLTTGKFELQEAKDKKIIQYIADLSDSIDAGVEVVTDKTKSGFITVVDFLFYDGMIAKTTFAELSDDAKSKVVELASSLIQKIDAKYPEFRASLSEKYQEASTFLVEKKDILVDKIKDKLGDEKVNQISEYYEEAKSGISDVYEKGKEKVKNWYENFRDKNSETSS